jgi:hypothetical protein
MSKFLVTYFGAGVPSDLALAAKVREAFGRWLAEAGSAVIDPGAPLAPATQVASGTPAPRVTISGYSVIEAENVEAAIEILKSHPFVARGGTLQVDESVSVEQVVRPADSR